MVLGGDSATPSFLMFSLLAEKKGDKALSIKILTDIIVDNNLKQFQGKKLYSRPLLFSGKNITHYFIRID